MKLIACTAAGEPSMDTLTVVGVSVEGEMSVEKKSTRCAPRAITRTILGRSS